MPSGSDAGRPRDEQLARCRCVAVLLSATAGQIGVAHADTQSAVLYERCLHRPDAGDTTACTRLIDAGLEGLGPKGAEAFSARGTAYLDSERYAEAEADFSKALEERVNYPAVTTRRQ